MLWHELKSSARKQIAENIPKLVFISIVYLLIITVLSEFQFRLPGILDAYDQYIQRLSSGELPSASMIFSNLRSSGLALAAVLWLMSSVVSVGYMSYCLKTTRGEAGEYRDLFDGFLFFGKIILIKLATTALTILWSLLFLFPGIAAHYRYRQAYYILIDDPKKGAFQCIKESSRLMHSNKLDLFLLDLSFAGWHMLNVVVDMVIPTPFSFPVVSILLKPYLGLTRAAFYTQLMAKLLV